MEAREVGHVAGAAAAVRSERSPAGSGGEGSVAVPPEEPGPHADPVPPEEPGPDAVPVPPGPRGAGPGPRRTGARLLVVTTVVAALVGAGAALGVARATGWGSQTVITEIANPGGIALRPANIRQILATILPSVVSITATSVVSGPFGSATVTSMGTGVVVAADGEVVTNDHVVTGARSVSVSLDGSSAALAATVVGESPANDLALVRITQRQHLTPAVFADSTRTAVGDEVLAVGYALGLSGGPTVTDGIISAIGRQVATGTGADRVTLTGMLQTDAAISSGNSGGPLVNASAQVVGINTAVATSSAGATAQNIGFAIPASTVQRLLPSLRAG